MCVLIIRTDSATLFRIFCEVNNYIELLARVLGKEETKPEDIIDRKSRINITPKVMSLLAG